MTFNFAHSYHIIARSGVFDEAFYLDANADVREDALDPLSHYLNNGWLEGRWPSPHFDPTYYLQRYKDVAESGSEPLTHWVEHGRAEGRQTVRQAELSNAGGDPIPDQWRHDLEMSGRFDADYYLRTNPDVRAADVDPLWHYVYFGEREGRWPTPDFDPKLYGRLYADIRRSGLNHFYHFVMFGEAEGRIGRSAAPRQGSPNRPFILFVSHDGIRAGAQKVLLEVVRWYARHTRYRLKTLILEPGELSGAFAEVSEVLTLNNADDFSSEEFKTFVDESFGVIYLNTVVSGRVLDHLPNKDRALVITHLHEMEKVIEEFDTEFASLKAHTDAWICAAKPTETYLTTSHGIPTDRISVVEAFIRLEASSSQEIAMARQAARNILGVADNEFLVLGCGTAYWRKDPEMFLETGIELFRRYPKAQVKFVWIGGGELLDDLKARVAAENLEGRVQFIGARPDASQMIAAADLFYLSSVEDPFPLVCLEAAQYGTPSILFEGASGITEFVRSDAGLTVASRNAADAVSAIVDLVRHPKKRHALGKVARERICAHHTSDIACEQIFDIVKQAGEFAPDVSVIIPNYNHERYLPERIGSVLNQTLRDIEVICLDDCSPDNSLAVMAGFSGDRRLSIHPNTKNTGSPFVQWRKGLDLARSEIVWIAESDDSCSLDFLEKLAATFDDPLVNIAIGRTEIINAEGQVVPHALEPYYNRAAPGLFDTDYKVDGHTEVERAMAFMCTFVNASGLLMRRSRLSSVLGLADGFKMCGDWLVYLGLLHKGKVAYRSGAVNYFRRHSASVVHKLEGTQLYFAERFEISKYVLKHFRVSALAFSRMVAEVRSEWERFRHKNKKSQLHSTYDEQVLAQMWSCRDNRRRINVGFYVHGLLFSSGGIERLATQLANEMAVRGHNVTVFCKNWGGAPPVYPLMESVKIREVEVEDPAGREELRRGILADKIEVFVPMLSESLFEPVIDACSGTGVSILASEHNDPWKIEELWWSREARQAAFRKVDEIHLLLERFKGSLDRDLKSRAWVNPNGIPLPSSSAGRLPQKAKEIIVVGRLEPQKRIDRAIKAFAKIAPKCPGWTLQIYGEGRERQKLADLIAQHRLDDRIILNGLSKNIEAAYDRAAISVLPSEFEGFGIVVLEAMRAAVPTIAFSDCNGPNEIIRSERDGLLVDSRDRIAGLARAMKRLIDHQAERERMGGAAARNVRRYDLATVIDGWEDKLMELAVPRMLRQLASNASNVIALPPRGKAKRKVIAASSTTTPRKKAASVKRALPTKPAVSGRRKSRRIGLAAE